MATSNRLNKGPEKAADNTESAPLGIGGMRHAILNDILKGAKKDRGRNHTIYLSAEVGNALDKQAKASGLSKSELIDRILGKILIDQY